MKIANRDFWWSRSRLMPIPSPRFLIYKNWMGGTVIEFRLFGYTWGFGWYDHA